MLREGFSKETFGMTAAEMVPRLTAAKLRFWELREEFKDDQTRSDRDLMSQAIAETKRGEVCRTVSQKPS